MIIFIVFSVFLIGREFVAHSLLMYALPDSDKENVEVNAITSAMACSSITKELIKYIKAWFPQAFLLRILVLEPESPLPP